MKFRKKPVVIEAVTVAECLTNAAADWYGLPEWLRASYDKGDVLFLPECIEILTLEGRMTANCSDWIIQGIKGELYPCKPDIFAATYEAVP